MNLAVRMGRG